MGNRPLCFIISPIGEAGSDTRKNADYLLDLIIRPALEGYDFEILRGDHCHKPNQIHEHVVQCIRDAALCIADISLPNVNVYYEVGRRDETGKPLILLRRSDAGALPVDLGTRRYIHYTLEAEGITHARSALKLSVQELAKTGFAAPQPAANDMEQMMLQLEQRLLSKLDPHLQTAAPKPERPKASPFGSLLSKPQKKPATAQAASRSATPAKEASAPLHKPTAAADPAPARPTDRSFDLAILPDLSAKSGPAKPKYQYDRTELNRLFQQACEKRDVAKIDELLDYIETTPLKDSPAYLNVYIVTAWKSGSRKAFKILCDKAVSSRE